MNSDATVVPVSSSPESLSPLPELLEDDSSVNLSVDVSLDSGRAETASLTQDSEMESAAPPKENPKEVSSDLTTDGKYERFEEKKKRLYVKKQTNKQKHNTIDVWIFKPSHDFCPDRLAADSEVEGNQPEADYNARLQSTNNGVLCFHIFLSFYFYTTYINT